MNRILRVVFAVAFVGITGFAAYFYFENKELKSRNPINKPEPGKPVYECATLNTSPMNWLTLKEAVKMVRAYGENQGKSIDIGWNNKIRANSPNDLVTESFVDSRYIVFPMDTIKKFMLIIEKMLAQRQPLHEDGSLIKPCDLGIKFYYAAYDSLKKSDKINESYKARHTLVLVPTYLNKKLDTYEDFFPEYKKASGRPESIKGLPIRNFLNGTDEDFPILGMEIVNNVLFMAKNHGSLCPPPKPCASEILELASKPSQE